MARIWEQNEELGEEDELVVTEHRDAEEPVVGPADESADEQAVETALGGGRNPLEELGEDVASSPARRGHDAPPREG